MRKDRRNINEQHKSKENDFQGDFSPIGSPSTDSDGRNINQVENKKKKPKKLGSTLKSFGIIALVVSFLSFAATTSGTVDTSETARNALETKVSTGASAGIILLEGDEDLGSEDHTVTHQSDAEEMKIWIWDYAAEDGDYVQVLVDGTPIPESFMILHKPRALMVPTTGNIEIRGIRDGGVGITYGVRYEVTGTSYFNTAPEGDVNTYEIIRE